MSVEENKAIGRQSIDVTNAAWPTGNWALMDAITAPDVVFQAESGPVNGREAYYQLLSMYRSAFPDGHFTEDDVIAEGDKVLVRMTATGTQQGEFLGFAPTSKRSTVNILNLMQIKDG